MTISILSIGSSMPDWIHQGHNTFATRLSPPWNINLIDIPSSKRTKNRPIGAILTEEGERLWRSRPQPAFNIALDRQGKHLSSQDFATLLQSNLAHGTGINFFIGGPEGLSQDMIERANQCISLSSMTFPHLLVRVILSEQIYRARSIAIGHPYHR